MTTNQQEVKNLRLCLRIHIWSSVFIVVLWASLVVYFYMHSGKLHFIGWAYLLVWAFVYYALRVKLKRIESGKTDS